MSLNDTSLALSAYSWAIRGVMWEIKICRLFRFGRKNKDRIIVLKELEKRFRKHREGLGTRKGK